jgi:hypothetical protein
MMSSGYEGDKEVNCAAADMVVSDCACVPNPAVPGIRRILSNVAAAASAAHLFQTRSDNLRTAYPSKPRSIHPDAVNVV